MTVTLGVGEVTGEVSFSAGRAAPQPSWTVRITFNLTTHSNGLAESTCISCGVTTDMLPRAGQGGLQHVWSLHETQMK